MNFNLINLAYKKRTSSRGITNLLKYFIKLKIGEISGNIYKSTEKTNNERDWDFLSQGEKILDIYIRKFLTSNSNENTIDIENKLGLQNIGLGCIVVPNVFKKLIIFTQKNSSFYFKTDKEKDYYVKINFVSIPKVSGSIKIEENILTSFNMKTLENKLIEIKINQKMIKESISKISIQIDKCWFPNYLDLTLPYFPLGIGITKISCK